MQARRNWVRVDVRWGNYELMTRHLRPGEAFVLAERGGDFAIAARQLGAERVELVRATETGAELVVPDPFTAQRSSDGAPPATCRARLVDLTAGERVLLEQGDVAVEVLVEPAVQPGVRWRRRRFGDWRLLASAVAAIVTCAVPLGAGALTFEEPGPGLDPSQIRMLRYYLGPTAGDETHSEGGSAPAHRATGHPCATDGDSFACRGELEVGLLPCLDREVVPPTRAPWWGWTAPAPASDSIYCRGE